MSSVSLSTMKIVLYGPSNSGKTTFKLTLLGKLGGSDVKPTEKTEELETLRTVYKVKNGKKFPYETYRLKLADVPGKEELSGERLSGLQKAIGILLFYDSTDLNSPEKLKKMVENEIIAMGYLYNLLGVVVVGTKKDIGPNPDAVKKAQEFVNEISSQIKQLWGYDVPHVLINAKNREETDLTLNLLEHLMMSYTVPQAVLDKISADKVLKGVAPPKPSLSQKMPSTITPSPPSTPKVPITKVEKKEISLEKQVPIMPEVPSPEAIISERQKPKRAELETIQPKPKLEIPSPEAVLKKIEEPKPSASLPKLPEVPSPKEITKVPKALASLPKLPEVPSPKEISQALVPEKETLKPMVPPMSKQSLPEMSPLSVPPKPSAREIKRSIVETSVRSVVEIPEKIIFKPISGRAIWDRLEEIAKKWGNIVRIILLKKVVTGDKQVVYYAYYVESSSKTVPDDFMRAIIAIDEISDRIQAYSDLGEFKHILIQGRPNTILIFKRNKSGVVYIETRGKPAPTLLGRFGV